MKIVEYLIKLFVEEHLTEICFLIIFSLGVNILTTNVITYFNSTLINAVQQGLLIDTIQNFKYFIYARVFTAIFQLAYKLIQDVVMTDLKQWSRYQLIKTVFQTNNENFSNVNFTKLSVPINRLSETFLQIVGDTLNYTFPYVTFVLVAIVYFFYQNVEIGTLFFIGNILWIGLLTYIFPTLRTRNIKYENDSMTIERHLTENLNNIDKIITRGQINEEASLFDEEKNTAIKSHRDYYYSVSITKFAIEMVTLLTMFLCIGHSINLYFKEKITIIQFIAITTLLFVFKERLNSTAALVSDNIEQYGRLEAILEWFNETEDKLDLMHKKYKNTNLSFEKVKFEDVTFQYDVKNEKVFDNKTMELETNNNKIVGIVGKSGRGKSTFVKLLLKLYNASEGNIFIDNVNIKEVDPDYLRDNITFINQNSRLFDKTVLENILYGCKKQNECKEHYQHILSYPKIQELYKNVDLTNGLAGYSGENLSGGQRQVANIISGLINPSKILVLDEPTNALDKELKMELIEIIRYFKPYKQCILIITHDKDVYSIFDEQLKL